MHLKNQTSLISRLFWATYRPTGSCTRLGCMNVKTGPLRAYLKELRQGKSPVDANRVQEFGLPTSIILNPASERANAEAFLELLRRGVADLGPADRIIVAHFLFTKGSAKEREKASLKNLEEQDISTSESYYRNGLRSALERYAVRLLTELSPGGGDTGGFIPSDRLTPTWFEVIEMDWALRLDESDYRRQYWRRKLLLRSLAAGQPIIMFAQSWSGSGRREGEVAVISGPNAGSKTPHECLRVRPEAAMPDAWDLYIFDLGSPILPGKTETLEYEETLYDEGDRFESFLTQSTARYPTLERIRFTIDIPDCWGISTLEAYREEPLPGSGLGYTPTPPIVSVSREDDGLFHHEVTDIDHEGRYAVRWQPHYAKR